MFFALVAAAWPGDENAASGETDAALVAAAQRGSVDAFATLHARYYSRVYRLAYLKTNNAADAEDVASETFLRALAGLPRFRFPASANGAAASLYPWLHRIALNLIVDTHRQRPPMGLVSLDAPLIEGMRHLLADQVAGSPGVLSPQAVVERHEVQSLVRAAIAALPDDQSDVLIHRFLGELSPREIAPLLQRSESAVKSLLHRAVVALRVEIERRLNAIERREAQGTYAQSQLKETVQHVGRG